MWIQVAWASAEVMGRLENLVECNEVETVMWWLSCNSWKAQSVVLV